jgi:hypothetical protein
VLFAVLASLLLWWLLSSVVLELIHHPHDLWAAVMFGAGSLFGSAWNRKR